jgi:hypothetical protein
MNTTASAALAGSIALAGRWAKGDKKISMNVIVGVGGMVLALAILNEVNQPFAQAFGMLLVVAAALVYLPDIVKWMGWSR